MNGLMLDILVLIYFFAIFILAFFSMHKLFLIYLLFRYQGREPSARSLPENFPLVAVQLPIFNERYVIKRLLKAIANLDYPQNKLHIQVLDDSTDRTGVLAQRLVKLLKHKGFYIEHIQRSDRKGFKAGALEYGLHKTKAALIAVFDADFIPQPGFLKDTLPYLMKEGVGMVQTCWGHINRNYSLLTRLQAILLDGHFYIEHFARNRSGRFFNFNGTAGIWQRQAIIDAGGWHHDTLTEDLDLSYRAQLLGWRFIFLPEVVTPAELPVDMNSFKNQQKRWAKGSIQTALKLLPRIIRSSLPFGVRMEAVTHLLANLTFLLLGAPAVCMIPYILFREIGQSSWLWHLYAIFLGFALLTVFCFYFLALKRSQSKLWPHGLYVPAAIILGVGLTVNNGLGVLEALMGKSSDFVRTPKYGIETQRDTFKGKLYRITPERPFLIEAFLGLYFSFGILGIMASGDFIFLPFLFLFQLGFCYTAAASFLHGRGV